MTSAPEPFPEPVPAWQTVMYAFLGLFALFTAVERLSDWDGGHDLILGILGIVVGISVTGRALAQVHRRRRRGESAVRREDEEGRRQASDDAVHAMTRARLLALAEQHNLGLDTSQGRVALIRGTSGRPASELGRGQDLGRRSTPLRDHRTNGT